MNKDKSFNPTVYKNAYSKAHYTNCNLRLKPEIAAKIQSYCDVNGCSKASFLSQAALYIIDNGIELPTNTEK